MFDPQTLDGVSLVRAGQFRDVADAITAGHAEYPSFRHLFPNPERRPVALRPFFEAIVRDAIPFNSVLAVGTAGRFNATAVWLPPGAFPWSIGRKLRALPAFARVLAAAPRSFPSFARYGATLERHHTGGDRYWYLTVLSVRPEHQRQGLGTRLIEPALERADHDGVACRLETSDPANVAYYQRFGFATVDSALEILPGGPPLITMRRSPRGAPSRKD